MQLDIVIRVENVPLYVHKGREGGRYKLVINPSCRVSITSITQESSCSLSSENKTSYYYFHYTASIL